MTSHDHIIVGQTYFHGPWLKVSFESVRKDRETFCLYGVRKTFCEKERRKLFHPPLCEFRRGYIQSIAFFGLNSKKIMRINSGHMLSPSPGSALHFWIYAHERKRAKFITKPFKDSHSQKKLFFRATSLRRRHDKLQASAISIDFYLRMKFVRGGSDCSLCEESRDY